MKREIKFRAYAHGKMYTYVDVVNGLPYGESEHYHDVDSDRELMDGILMQYTGLKDKNGVEIYEGDIPNEGTVIWCNSLSWDGMGSTHSGFYFKEGFQHDEEGELDYHTRFDKNTEVLGNIHENPELLK